MAADLQFRLPKGVIIKELEDYTYGLTEMMTNDEEE
jgi:hypothetical protein